MAHLQHESIVQVYSESVEPNSDTRLFCMQYVPGCTFQKILERFQSTCSRSASRAKAIYLVKSYIAGMKSIGNALAKSDPSEFTGEHLIAAVNKRRSGKTQLNDEGIAVRELLIRKTYSEAVCRIGARLAEALAHAHHIGMLHRDIKAANV